MGCKYTKSRLLFFRIIGYTDGIAAKEDSRLFHIRCAAGSHTFCLLGTYIALFGFLGF